MASINTCEPFKFGMNYAWRAFGLDFGGGNAGLAQNKATLNAALQDMAAHSAEIVRVWIYPDFRAVNNGGITFETTNPDCVQSVGGTTQADIEAFTSCAFDAGLQIMWTFFSFNANDTNATQGVTRPTIRESIVDAICRQSMMDNMISTVTNFIVNAPNYADTFHSYDLFNEPEFMMDGTNPVDNNQNFTDYKVTEMGIGNSVNYTQMQTFLSQMANTIKSIDANACITVGTAGKKWVTAWESIVDFNSPHSYAWDEAYFPGSNTPQSYGFTKPTMIGEYPPDGMSANAAFAGQVAGALPKTHDQLLCQWAENNYFGALFWSYTDGNTPGVNTDLQGNMDEANSFMQDDVFTGVDLDITPSTYNCALGPSNVIIRPMSNKDQPVLINEASLSTDLGSFSNLQYVPSVCYYTATYTPPACPSEIPANITAQDTLGNDLTGRITSFDAEPVCVTGNSSCSMTYSVSDCNVPTDCQVSVEVACNCKINISKILGGDPNCPQFNEIFEWAISGCDCPGKCGPVVIDVKAGYNASPICWLEDQGILRIGPVCDTSSISFKAACALRDPCVNYIENGPCKNHTEFVFTNTSAQVISLTDISTDPILIDQILWSTVPDVADVIVSPDSRSLLAIGKQTGTTRVQVRMRDINNNYYDCTVNVVVNL